ncbi:MAG: NAD(P)-dependent oxidoreductase [Sphingomonadales bacterium]|nr:NAD(P)-dependent oxidoreductase [Sphingomonadales bacterium]
MRVGVAGVGRMGAAIAARLIEVGHEVSVWNRTAEGSSRWWMPGPRPPAARPSLPVRSR